ncbi:hypothetical protein TYRP_014002 [Tyrophagus putrescentiae]|nr:hypothetical protein TYRP_014002 [Tyrophagus putrescentiae]
MQWSSTKEEINFEKYLIHTPNCAIERIPLFTPDTAHMFRRYQSREYDCPPDDGSAAIKRVNFTWVQVPVENCVAREVEREASTEGGQYGRTFYFGNRTVMNFPTSDALIVACRNFQLQRIVPLIPHKKPLYFSKSNPKSQNNRANRPNILAIGVDSISRLNMLRHFIETKKFIDEKHFEGPLYGLHKIGDNTWPNLIGMFTGLDLEGVEKTIPDSRKLDNVPLIFKEFSAAGYMNTYIENMPNFGLWTYHWKNGFIHQPIEYWMRPVNILVFKELQRHYCYKEKLEMELYFDYLIDQMLAFRQRDQHFLSIVHMASVTHDFLNYAQYADMPVLRF